MATWGNLHLKSGLAAARAGDRTAADTHLAEAKQTAGRIGVDRDDYRLCFGPTNVNIWLVGLAVEMLDGTEAITRADTFTSPDQPLASEPATIALWPPSTKPDTPHLANPISHPSPRNRRRPDRADKRRTDTRAHFAGWLGITT